MDAPKNSFSWATKLGCPKSICSDRAISALSKGISGCVWDDLSRFIHSTTEVNDAKKNILLYKLRVGSEDPAIASVCNLKKLKSEREKLNEQIKSLEEKCAQQDCVNRQKAQQHKQKKDTSQKLQIKKYILETKCKEVKKDIIDLQNMQKLCDLARPPVKEVVEQSMIDKSLELIGTLASGANKQEVWHKVHNMIGSIKISVLWHILWENRVQMNEKLFELVNNKEVTCNENADTSIEVGLANLYSQHIEIECSKLIHESNTINHQNEVLRYIEIIESKCLDKCPDIGEWLPLKLEVRKMEVTHANLQHEIKDLDTYLSSEAVCDSEYLELLDIAQNLKTEIGTSVQDLQKSLHLLKCAGSIINMARQESVDLLQTITVLHHEFQETSWLNADLTTELVMFHKQIDMDALRKIMLKGNVMGYRHLTTCINEALTSVTVPVIHNKLSPFPMAQAPIYYLIKCFEAFILKSTLQEEDSTNLNLSLEKLKQFDSSEMAIEKCDSEKGSNVQNLHYNYATNLLHLANAKCEETNEHINDTYHILDLWVNQTVQKALSIPLGEVRVNGATLKEWLQNYSIVIYMLQRSK